MDAARIAGLLLILGVVTSVIASGLVSTAAVTHASEGGLASEDARVCASVLLQFLTAAGALGIALALYPAVRRHSPTLAVGAVSFRGVEAAFSCLAALALVGLLAVSESTGHDPALWSTLVAMRNASNYVFGVLFYGVGAGHYLVGLHRARLLPRWLTVWGMAGAALVALSAAGTLLSGPPFALRGGLTAAAVPIALQEIVFGAWLLRFGFRAATTTAGDATAVSSRGLTMHALDYSRSCPSNISAQTRAATTSE
jgi:hypothetical protein